jgi:hypothetical protein
MPSFSKAKTYYSAVLSISLSIFLSFFEVESAETETVFVSLLDEVE